MNGAVKIQAAVIVVLGLCCGFAAGCSQSDVGSADKAFHQAAQATHDTGKDIAAGVKHAGQDVKKDTKGP